MSQAGSSRAARNALKARSVNPVEAIAVDINFKSVVQFSIKQFVDGKPPTRHGRFSFSLITPAKYRWRTGGIGVVFSYDIFT
jgi:hypothetical protein